MKEEICQNCGFSGEIDSYSGVCHSSVCLGKFENKCIDCKKVRTTNVEDGKRICVVCGNDRYFKELRDGKRIELKLKLSEYIPGTLEEIKMVIAKNRI